MTINQLVSLLEGIYGVALMSAVLIRDNSKNEDDYTPIDGISFDAITNVVYIDINIPR